MVFMKWGELYHTFGERHLLPHEKGVGKFPPQRKSLLPYLSLDTKNSLDLICHPSWNKQEVSLIAYRYCFFLSFYSFSFTEAIYKIDFSIWIACLLFFRRRSDRGNCCSSWMRWKIATTWWIGDLMVFVILSLSIS
jgi:hypothetical protein